MVFVAYSVIGVVLVPVVLAALVARVIAHGAASGWALGGTVMDWLYTSAEAEVVR
jgi:hypothetical protein